MKFTSKFLFLPIILILFSFIGCEQKHNLEDLKAEINSINEQLSKAILANDHETPLKLYTEDAISLPSYQPMMKGMAALKEHSEKQKEMPMNWKSFSLTSTDVWISGKFVIDIGTYSLNMEMPDAPGGEWEDHGKYLTVFEIQKDGSLLMKADIWNTDVNPWMEMKQYEENKSEGESKM